MCWLTNNTGIVKSYKYKEVLHFFTFVQARSLFLQRGWGNSYGNLKSRIKKKCTKKETEQENILKNHEICHSLRVGGGGRA